jgi:hypothetical protein
MKIIIIALLLIILLPHFIFSKNRVISGFVRDSLNNEPLIGATVWDVEKKIGTSTDNFGHYALTIPNKQETLLEVSFIGYQTKKIEIEKTAKRVDFYLSEGLVLEEISVIGQKRIEERIETGVLSVPISQMKKLPVIGEPDVLKIMQLMPGIQGGSEGRSGLFVRGGSADQNLMLLDGAPVYYVNHYGNFLSLFHPEIISSLKLYKGAFPAKYGGRLSSVVDMRMREGNKKEHKGSFGIGLLSADILLEGPIKKDTTSYIFSARRFYLDAIMRPAILLISDFVTVGYQFYDIYGKISHAFNEDSRLFISLYAGEDSYGFRILPWEDENFKGKSKTSWGNILTTARLNSKINNKMVADFILGYTRYFNGQFQNYDIDSINFYSGTNSNVQDFSFKSEFNYTLSNWYEMSFGAGVVRHRFQPGSITSQVSMKDSIMSYNSFSNPIHIGWEPHAYLESIIKPFNFAKFNIGARYSSYWVDGYNYQKIEPRLLVVLGTNTTGVFKLSYTENMQPLHLLSYQNMGSPNDLWMPATAKIPPAQSAQYSIEYAKTLFRDYEISLQAYQKEFYNMIDYKDGVSYNTTDQDWQEKVEINGVGTSKGIEFLFRKNSGNTTGWLGYTLSKTDRFFESKNNGNPYPYIYDRRHDLSLVINHSFNKKYNLSASWVFGTGYPMTLDIGYYQNFMRPGYMRDNEPEGINPYVLAARAVLYSDKNGVRMGNMHKLDIAFNINGKTKKGRDKTWSFNLYNAYNRQNPAHYYYDWVDRNDKSKGKSLWQQSGIPIMPSFTYRVSW